MVLEDKGADDRVNFFSNEKKEIMKQMGFEKAVKDVEEGYCPFCGKIIDITIEFRDSLSLKEYRISGLCQVCQDETFGK